jgi:hypothetical protein
MMAETFVRQALFYAVGIARGRPVRSVDDFLSKTIGESYSS